MTIIPNSMNIPTTALHTKSIMLRTIYVTVDDNVGFLLYCSCLAAEVFIVGLRLDPIRRTQNDIEGLPLSSEEVAQTMVDHSSSE